MPDEDCTFTAQWQPEIYTITFDMNGGDSASIEVQQEYGTYLEVQEAYKTGHNLVGWFTQQVDGTQVGETTMVTGDATYYAHWEIANYNVFYDTDNVDINIPETDDFPRTHTVYDEITPPALDDKWPSTFLGWSPSTMPVGTDEPFTFTAMWDTEQATVTFDANGGSGIGDMSRRIDIGSPIGDPPQVVRGGYYLVGWYDSLEDGNLLTEDTELEQDTTYYAIWMKDTYTITYRDNIPVTIDYDRNY